MHDAFGNFVLEVEDILELAVEAFGPDMGAGFGIDQLGGNAETISRLAHAAFKHIARAKLASDLLHIDLLALVGERRVACDHRKQPP